jgi:magnesium transporter
MSESTEPAEPPAGPAMVVNCVAYAGGRRVGDLPIDRIGEAVEAGQFVWVGLYEPSEDLMKEVQAELHLHDLAVEDAHRAHQRPKLEYYGEDLFVVLRTAQFENGDIAFGETHLFAGKGYLVSVRHGASLPYVEVRARCEKDPELLRAAASWFVLYALMDFVVDHYQPIVEALGDKLEEVEETVFGGHFHRGHTERIYALKRDLVAVKHAVAPLVEMVHQLVRVENGHRGEAVRLHFRDVHDHVVRVNQNVDSLRDLLSAVLEANLALITVQQNDVMKKLAAYAALFAVPTMIAGIYGMNFAFIPGAEWKFGFLASIGAMVAVCAFLYRLFKRAEWL